VHSFVKRADVDTDEIEVSRVEPVKVLLHLVIVDHEMSWPFCGWYFLYIPFGYNTVEAVFPVFSEVGCIGRAKYRNIPVSTRFVYVSKNRRVLEIGYRKIEISISSRVKNTIVAEVTKYSVAFRSITKVILNSLLIFVMWDKYPLILMVFVIVCIDMNILVLK